MHGQESLAQHHGQKHAHEDISEVALSLAFSCDHSSVPMYYTIAIYDS